MSITEFDLQNMQRRLARATDPKGAAAKDKAKSEAWEEGEEKSLQEAIETDALRRGFYVWRSRMDKRTRSNLGFPDLVIFGPNGKCVLIECKAGTNDLSDDQRKCHVEIIAAGAIVVTVWNLKDAIDLMIHQLVQPL